MNPAFLETTRHRLRGRQGESTSPADYPAGGADYIVVEIARHVLGSTWMEDYVAKANAGGIERVLV